MKKRRIQLLVILAIFSVLITNAQTAPDGHENHYKNPDPIETEEYKIEFQDVIAENEFAKFKVTITNNTAEYLLVDLSMVVFKFEHGEYKPEPEGKMLIIAPSDDKSKVLEVNGDTRFHVETFSVDFGYIATLPLTGETVEVDSFRLPPAAESFTSGPITCSIGRLKKESRITATDFKCQYNGDHYLFTNPLSISAKLEDGQTFPNVAKVGGLFGGPDVLQKGDKANVPVEFRISTKIIDMQFATFYIMWNKTFVESEPVQVDSASAKFVLDIGKTEAQN